MEFMKAGRRRSELTLWERSRNIQECGVESGEFSPAEKMGQKVEENSTEFLSVLTDGGRPFMGIWNGIRWK